MLRKVAALMAVVLLSGSAAVSQSLFFPSRNDFDAGTTFASQFTELGIRVASGDFDGDGITDAVVVNEFGIQPLADPTQGESLAVLRGDGRGLFLPPTFLNLALNSFAGDVVTGDFNGDTFLDIAAAVEDLDGTTGGGGMGPGTTGGVALFLGDGGGGFAAAQLLPGGNMDPGFTGLVAGRLNGDNLDDIVLLNTADGTFTVFLGVATGSPVPTTGSPFTTCSNPVAADLGTLDFIPGTDLAIACDPPGSGNEEIQLFSNGGNGVFTPFTNQPVSTTLTDPRSLVIADLNGDGANDLAIANSFLEAMTPSGSVSFLKGDGVGGFSETFVGGIAQPVGNAPRSIDAGDVDGDGDMDLVVSNWDTDDISILVASLTGSGTGAAPTYTETFFAAGIRTFDARFADLDGTGNLDLLAVNANDFDGILSSYLGGGPDLVLRATRFTSLDMDAPNAMAVADFDGDGADDFAVVNAFGDSLSVFRSTALDMAPATPFAELGTPLLFNPMDLPFDILAQDLDGDNDPDLVVLLSPDTNPMLPMATPGQVAVFVNDGTGLFSAAGAPFNVGLLPWTMVCMNFNGDAFKDLAVTNLGDDTVSVFLGGPGATFTPAVPPTFDSRADMDCLTSDKDCLPTGLAAGDLDGNGTNDLVISTFGKLNGGALEIFSGGGDGTFVFDSELMTVDPFGDPNAPVIPTVSHQVVRLSHLDGQPGPPDLVAVGLSPDDFISVFMNDGAGNLTFTPAAGSPFLMPGMDIASPDAPRNSLLTDLNMDGLPDLAVTGIASNNVAVALGNGDGTFSSSRARVPAFGTVKEANAVGAGDFDADGTTDLAVAGLRLSDISLLHSGLIRRADTNGDGRVDGFDLVQVTRNWAVVVGPAGFFIDINMDGTVDPVDLSLLAAAFGMVF